MGDTLLAIDLLANMLDWIKTLIAQIGGCPDLIQFLRHLGDIAVDATQGKLTALRNQAVIDPFHCLDQSLGVLEHAVGRRRGRSYYEGRDTVANLSIGAGSQVFGMFYLALFIGTYAWVFEHVAPARFAVTPLSVLGCFLALDFAYYWAHRFSHEWNFLWGGHIVHHSSDQMNIAIGFRQPWFHHLPGFVFFLPVAFLGFPPVVFWTIIGLMRIYPLFLHTEAVRRMPDWYEVVFNTPSHHRVHHGRERKYRDTNYGAVLILWDKLFGTFRAEVGRPAYGVWPPLHSSNPLWANVHYYAHMIDVARACPTLRQKLYVLVARPGWRPEGAGPIGVGSKPSADVKGRISLYVAAQVALSVVGVLAFMYYFNELAPMTRVWLGVVMVATLLSLAGRMECRRWANPADIVRWAVVFAGVLVLLAR